MVIIVIVVIITPTPTTTPTINICLNQIKTQGLTKLHIPAAKTYLVSWHLVHFLEEKALIFFKNT